MVFLFFVLVAPLFALCEAGASRFDQLEFNGYVRLGEKPSFSIRDTVSNHNYWIRLHDSNAGISVLDFDQSTLSVTLRIGDEIGDIALKRIVIQTLNVTPVAKSRDQHSIEQRLELEDRMDNIVAYDMALGHLARQEDRRRRIQELAAKAVREK